MTAGKGDRDTRTAAGSGNPGMVAIMEGRLPAGDEMAFYATPGPMTTFAGSSKLLDGLPKRATTLCGLPKKLIVHEFMAESYGVTDVQQRLDELRNRTIDEIVAAIDRLDDRHRPLARGRPPKKRLIGNCRQFTVLAVALLRHAGMPARARAGFSAYLDDTWTDHWVVERWDAKEERWIRTDTQLDDVFHDMLGYTFDPLNLPDGEFIDASEAWQRCRAGKEDPARFGVAEMRGLWFVQGSTIRDLAALNKIELLPWDAWGLMVQPDEDIDDERAAVIDELADVVVSGKLSEWQDLYQRDGFKVPATVFDSRFQQEVRLPVDVG
jgi:Transglutaminase-like superfamily